MIVLEASRLSKRFGGVRAVDDISFQITAGEMLALIGPNGAGKSTCFNIVNGQLTPEAGRVTLAGRNITGLSPRRISRMGVGRTFQITATFASMTVRENVQLALLAHYRQAWRFTRPAGAWHVDQADQLLAQVEMQDQSSRAAAVLAYGDLKRLELAIALANAPALLLMDEPTAGMAPVERIALMQLARRLATERGMAILFTEHDMDVVFGAADRILVLDRGKLIAEGDGPSIRANPDVRAVYLGSGVTSGGH
jgi:branched-chain amino acid transport system ATP-binding protein